MPRLHNMLPFRRAWLGLALLGSVQFANAAQLYCSSQNTGSSNSALTDIYMSNGLCSDECRATHAFAVVQWQQCWCSNIIPATAQQESVSQCSQECPGFPSELCGNLDSNLFGYIQLDLPPSGTAGGASSSTPSRTTSSTIVSSRTSFTPSSTPSSTSEEPQTSISSRTTSSSSATTSQPTTSYEPVTSVIVSVVSGETVTQFVTSTPSAASNADQISAVSQNEGLSAGAVAGIVIGVVAGLAVIAIAAFLLWRRKKNAEAEAAAGAAAGGGRKNMTRNVSVLSKAGLLSRGDNPSMGERDTDDAFAAHNGNSGRHSMLFGLGGGEGVSPTSPLGSSHGDNASTRRMSKPMVYDQRLNPSALFSNSEANGSRISMQDTQDYSRPLGVTNPDPRPSFESRT